MSKRRPFWLDKADPLHSTYVDALYDACEKGYSVIELQRILNHSTARNLYDTLRDEGYIPKLQRKRWPKLKVHPALAKALEDAKLSFLQWTNSHSLDPFDAAIALDVPVDDSAPESVAAHKALHQDFRMLAAKIYGLPVPPARSCSDSKMYQKSKYSVTIEYSEENDCFEAYNHDHPDARFPGATADEALLALKQRYLYFLSINKLRLLPTKTKE